MSVLSSILSLKCSVQTELGGNAQPSTGLLRVCIIMRRKGRYQATVIGLSNQFNQSNHDSLLTPHFPTR
ncbi:hypothetical protein Y032_0139g2098 [Ancylostoma ceylanicum]|uniref:Uncharacterized protein n=1 Tax=Ancylostoma ceylanicum TaxID=53326 RepID=A0A016T4I1_9BILA|nr:hypothetical protein Y032_0139g2098 [Ancylostoma ceylanicum]